MHKMKFLTLLFILLLASCSSAPKIQGAFIDGECKPTSINLEIIKRVSIEELDLELKKIYRNGINGVIEKEYDQLKLTLSEGGFLYEISSDQKSWQALHGSWGYGVVSKNCLVSYLQLMVS